MAKDLLSQDKKVLARKIVLLIYDVFSIYFSGFLALYVGYNFSINDDFMFYLDEFINDSYVLVIITIGVFYIFRLYSSLWVYASVKELDNLLKACIIVIIGSIAVHHISNHSLLDLPNNFYVIYLLLFFSMIFLSRFLYREIREIKNNLIDDSRKKKVLMVGAGVAGATILKEINNSDMIDKKVVCIVDDDNKKIGHYLSGVFVAGGIDDIPEIAEKYNVEEIMIAIPSAGNTEMKRIVEICKDTGIELMTLPGIYQLVNGEMSVSQLRKVDIQDLLGRDPVEINMDSLTKNIENKVIMVTGGGGSIGSEICRQIASYNPKQLILVDIYENTTYEIQNELRTNFPELNLVVLIASVRNTRRINQIFEEYRPQIVYHAAAHKHVPLMEISPNEAIKNNVVGTWKMVTAADEWNVEKFVMISTDKAVNPTNVMGASKRICEMIIQVYNNRSMTEFVAVRFGNVLGSNGSVIPMFKKQIAAGGPVTVTHPEIIRYFMTIKEAVSLVLQAGAFAEGGEIFVLDMGDPVKIDDLARNLIALSGFKPDVDIKIEYTGLRPGEKLFEELLMEEEGLQKTENKLIYVGKPIEIDEDEFLEKLADLKDYVETEPNDIKRKIKGIVTTYSSRQN
jgi:FlaA1/EpsC-like NDP-sugar epimerase